MDKKKMGKITFKEFLVWLSEISHGTVDDKIAWTFRLYDANEDGAICSEDLSSVIKSIYFLMGRRKDAPDDDNLTRQKVDLFFEVSLLHLCC
jgi:Ca2+-binding EF-hand superfamily protein